MAGRGCLGTSRPSPAWPAQRHQGGCTLPAPVCPEASVCWGRGVPPPQKGHPTPEPLAQPVAHGVTALRGGRMGRTMRLHMQLGPPSSHRLFCSSAPTAHRAQHTRGSTETRSQHACSTEPTTLTPIPEGHNMHSPHCKLSHLLSPHPGHACLRMFIFVLFACGKVLMLPNGKWRLISKHFKLQNNTYFLSDGGVANTEAIMYVVVTDELKLWCLYSLCNMV